MNRIAIAAGFLLSFLAPSAMADIASDASSICALAWTPDKIRLQYQDNPQKAFRNSYCQSQSSSSSSSSEGQGGLDVFKILSVNGGGSTKSQHLSASQF
ncbi:MAG: hypothetical protein ACREET_18740, partial [Stellaceae bacterium]